MTWYRSIRPVQSQPFALENDPQGRAVYGFTATVSKAYSENIEEELVLVLEADEVGVFNETIFAGKKAVIPSEGLAITVIVEGGPSPSYVHNQTQPKEYHPSVTVQVHHWTERGAVSKAWEAFRSLAGVLNRDITVV